MIELGPGVDVAPEELVYRATSASGPGGQNVNKVATRIELTWNVGASRSLDDVVRARLQEKLASRIDGQGPVRVVASDQRTQKANREAALERLRALVSEALKVKAPRKASKPSRAARQRRLDAKKRRGEIKRQRRNDDH